MTQCFCSVNPDSPCLACRIRIASAARPALGCGCTSAVPGEEPRGHTVKGVDGATTTSQPRHAGEQPFDADRLQRDLRNVERASTGIDCSALDAALTRAASAAVSIKDSNPKDGVGVRKVPFHLVPAQVVGEIALGMAEGDLKYGSYNFRAIGVRASVYYSAAERHLKAFWEGEDIDAESRLSHITKALSTLTVLRDAMLNDKWEDDRPPAVSNPSWLAELNTKMSELLDRVPRKQQGWTARNILTRLLKQPTSSKTEGTK